MQEGEAGLQISKQVRDAWEEEAAGVLGIYSVAREAREGRRIGGLS